MPQLVVGGFVEPGQRLPLVEQLAQPVGAVAPVVALRRSSRPRRRSRSLACLGLLELAGALGSRRCLALLRRSAAPSASSRALEPGEVADRVGSTSWAATCLTDSVASSGVSAPGRDPLLEQLHLEGQRVEAPVKKASASSGVPSGYWPTARSPSAVRT